MKKVLIPLGVLSLLVAGGYYWWSQWKLVQNYKVDVVGLKLKSFTLDSTTVGLSLKVTSYTSIEAVLSDVNINITVNGVFVGSANNPDKSTIPANGYNIFSMSVKLNNNNFLNSIGGILSAGENIPITIKLDGTTKIASGFIFVTIPVQTEYTTTLHELLQGV